jgi:hypothetical protein
MSSLILLLFISASPGPWCYFGSDNAEPARAQVRPEWSTGVCSASHTCGSATGVRSLSSQQSPANEIVGATIKLYPLDEGPKDPSFQEFRNRLLKAAREHDSALIVSILDPRVMSRSDGELGVKEFKGQWAIDQPDSSLWETLTTVLLMGGSFRVKERHREFCAPYVTSKWSGVVSRLPRAADPLDYEVIICKGCSSSVGSGFNCPCCD